MSDLWDMSDEELDSAFKEAKAQEQSPDTDLETEQVEESADEVEDTSTDEEEFDETENSDEEDTVESDEEEIDDGSEQPEDLLEDSDHDSSDETETDEVEEDNTTETEEDASDGDSETEEEESSEDTTEEDDEEQPARSYSFKANGKDYEFSSEEIVDQFPKIFGKAMDYTKKMQTIKPWRKTIDAIEGAKLSHDDVSLMIDVLKGDKEAITEVLKRTGTNTDDIDTEENSNYEAKDYGRDESAIAISDIVDEISGDTEYATTHSILSKEWDERSWETITENPNMVRLLHEDVKSGMYKTLQPLAEKLKVYDNGTKSDLDYYKAAAQQHFSKVAEQKTYADNKVIKQQQAADAKLASEAAQKSAEENQARVSKAKEQSDKRVATKKASAKRKAAAPTKSVKADRVVDYLDDSDESFDEWYKQLENSL